MKGKKISIKGGNNEKKMFSHCLTSLTHLKCLTFFHHFTCLTGLKYLTCLNNEREKISIKWGDNQIKKEKMFSLCLTCLTHLLCLTCFHHFMFLTCLKDIACLTNERETNVN
jgi:hypothetical protein